MVDTELFRALALAFKGTSEQPHFEKTSFRVRKKIFATLDEGQRTAVLKLTEIDQSVFCSLGPMFYPVPGAWGKKGWTMVDLDQTSREMLEDALTTAFYTVAPESFGHTYRNNENQDADENSNL